MVFLAIFFCSIFLFIFEYSESDRFKTDFAAEEYQERMDKKSRENAIRARKWYG